MLSSARSLNKGLEGANLFLLVIWLKNVILLSTTCHRLHNDGDLHFQRLMPLAKLFT